MKDPENGVPVKDNKKNLLYKNYVYHSSFTGVLRVFFFFVIFPIFTFLKISPSGRDRFARLERIERS